MYWPDTQTGVDVEPARKPIASAVRKFFTEGGAGQAPTVPGGDWFNQITNELLNVLAAAGIDPSKADDDQLLQAIQAIQAGGFTLEGTLAAEPEWADVPAYDGGGPGGKMNEQAQALANQIEWLRHLYVIVTDKKYAGGAKGDGITDDSAAIKAANDEAIRTRKRLYFPQGNYVYSQAGYAFALTKHMYWIGENATITLKCNGRVFDVKTNYSAAMRGYGLNFIVDNPTVNNDVTVS